MEKPQLRMVIREAAVAGQHTSVDLMFAEKSLSHCSIVPLTVRIGRALVRLDGIGGVGTDPEHRMRGYSRQVMEASVEQMRRGDAALSGLYGIRDFYPRFGYATAGADHLLFLKDLERKFPMPDGWTARPFTTGDMPAVRGMYEEGTKNGVGAAERARDGRIWQRLSALPAAGGLDGCRVVADPAGVVRGYAWRGSDFWYVGNLQRAEPESLVLGEVFADGPEAADALLGACRAWAEEEASRRGTRVRRVDLALPPEGPVYAAATYHGAEAVQRFSPCGGMMARVLNTYRLLAALAPELTARIQASTSPDLTASLRIDTEVGSAHLQIHEGQVTVTEGPGGAAETAVTLPQTMLARLALGAFPPGDLLTRLPDPPNAETIRLLSLLFPSRYHHMHLPDRY